MGRATDILCGALSGLIAAAAWAGIQAYEWTPERLQELRAAEREGVYAVRGRAPDSPAAGLVASDVGADESRLPAQPAPADVEDCAPESPTLETQAASVCGAGVSDARGEGRVGSSPPARPELPAAAVWLREMTASGVDDLADHFGKTWAESRFDPEAVSPVGARGLAQGMPRTIAEEYPRTEPSCEGVSPFDPACSARFQASYADRIEKWLPADARTTELRHAAYNWGIGNVKKRVSACRSLPGCAPAVWESIAPMMPDETRRYVDAIAGYASAFRAAATRGDWELSGSVAW